MVSVMHAGMEQGVMAGTLTPSKAEISAEMKVLETTDKAPAWKVAMRHVQVRGWSADGAGGSRNDDAAGAGGIGSISERARGIRE